MLQLIDSLSVTSGRFGYSGTGRAISDSQPLRRWIGSTRVFTALVCFVRGTRWGNNENVPQACFVIWCGDFSDVWFFWLVLNSTRGFYFTRFTRQFLEGHEHAKHAMDVRRSIDPKLLPHGLGHKSVTRETAAVCGWQSFRFPSFSKPHQRTSSSKASLHTSWHSWRRIDWVLDSCDPFRYPSVFIDSCWVFFVFLLSVSTGHPEVERSCVYTASSQHLQKRREVYAATNSLCCADGTAGRNHRLFGAEEGKGAWLVAITMQWPRLEARLVDFRPTLIRKAPLGTRSECNQWSFNARDSKHLLSLGSLRTICIDMSVPESWVKRLCTRSHTFNHCVSSCRICFDKTNVFNYT